MRKLILILAILFTAPGTLLAQSKAAVFIKQLKAIIEKCEGGTLSVIQGEFVTASNDNSVYDCQLPLNGFNPFIIKQADGTLIFSASSTSREDAVGCFLILKMSAFRDLYEMKGYENIDKTAEEAKAMSSDWSGYTKLVKPGANYVIHLITDAGDKGFKIYIKKP